VSRKRKQTAGLQADQPMGHGDHLEKRAPNKQLTHHSAAGIKKNK